MNKKISVGIALSLVLVAVTVTFTATMIFSMRLFDSKVSSATERAQMYDKISEIDQVIRQNYYGEIDDASISNSLAQGIVGGLGDDRSAYLTSEQIAARSAEMLGSAVSTGLSVEKNTNGYVEVNNVAAESPAARMEMQAGDIITQIDGEDVLLIGYDEAVSRLANGIEGTKIALSFNRAGEEHTVEIVPTTVEFSTVLHSQIEDVYFIRIDRVTDLTLNQFRSAVAAAEEAQDIRGIVVDVRDLSGGYDLEIIAGMLDRMLPTGTIVSGIYRGGEQKVLYTSDEEAVSLPVAVIVNERTSGFAELFAAVMNESSRCTLVGQTTAGNGTLQQLIRLTDGSGVLVTVAELRTPGGESFDKTGVAPGFEVSVPDSFIRLVPPNGQTDPQFAKAVEILRAAA